jgi:hypothetical protein
VHSRDVREQALRLLADGLTLSQVSRTVRVSRSTLRDWRADPQPLRRDCPNCDEAPLSAPDYYALLGYYLGDGCVSTARRYFALRVSCDAAYPGIVSDVEQSIRGVRPGRRIFRVNAPGCVVVQSNWKHWPCLFPQHGPGRKHERTIALEAWQQEVVDEFPGGFLRGLFHSDGCRAKNWASRVVAGEVKRNDYPRWQFTNNSSDIRAICCRALDVVDVPWRQSNWKTISVSTRVGVARLDALIGLKT